MTDEAFSKILGKFPALKMTKLAFIKWLPKLRAEAKRLSKLKADRLKTKKGGNMQRTASILGKRMTQEVSADDLLTYNSTKKKVFAVIPFDKISSSGLMDSPVITLVKQFGSTDINSHKFFN